jgi:ribosomal-protein-serine acetyltransferase
MLLTHTFAEGAEIKLLQPQDTEDLFALIELNRSYLRRWLPAWDVQNTLEDCRTVIKNSLERLAANCGSTLGIWYQGHLAGVIGAGGIDWENRCAVIGYWLGESFQGKGLMTGACRTLVDYLFFELNLHRIEIRCAVGNERSCAVPKRLGFTKEGILRQAQAFDDQYFDLEVYGLLAEDWIRATE